MGRRPQHDIRRDAWLESRGVMVMRIGARELTYEIEAVADAIVRLAVERL